MPTDGWPPSTSLGPAGSAAMIPRPLRWTLLVVTVLAGCDPNPSGPSAPSAPTAGPSPATTQPMPKATKGAVPLRVPD
jgi:hypothetical protein